MKLRKPLLLGAATAAYLLLAMPASADETGAVVVPAQTSEVPPPPKKRVRVRLVTGGTLLFGIPYSFGLTGASVSAIGGGPNRYNWLLLPGVGPLVLMAETTNATGNVVLALDALAQGSGIAMLTYALISPAPATRESTPATISFAPLVGAGRAGMSVVGRF